MGATLLLLAAASVFAQEPGQSAQPLGGTSWRLVKFQGSDDTTLTPDDKAKYTIEFGADGNVSARIDCNRGRGTWTSSGPNQLRFGPLALTRAMCPPGSLNDRIAKDLGYVRLVRDEGRPPLSFIDGRWRDLRVRASSRREISRGQISRRVHRPGRLRLRAGRARAGTLQATFYQTQPAMVLVERAGQTRPAFRVTAASGARYQGQNLNFWEARGEASVTWSGEDLECKRLTTGSP